MTGRPRRVARATAIAATINGRESDVMIGGPREAGQESTAFAAGFPNSWQDPDYLPPTASVQAADSEVRRNEGFGRAEGKRFHAETGRRREKRREERGEEES
jgi:hypothetical protein